MILKDLKIFWVEKLIIYTTERTMFSDGSDTTDTESPSNEVGLKLLYEEMKELKSSTKINKNRKIRQSSTGFC